MRATKLIALLSVVGFALASQGTIKSKLAQTGAKSLAQVDVEGGDDCGCGCGPKLPFGWDLPERSLSTGTVEADSPAGLGATLSTDSHTLTSSVTHLGSTQDTVITEVPDSSYTASETHTSVAVQNAVHDAYSNATKIRHFAINGDICVTESVTFAESSIAEESSVGGSDENVYHSETLSDAGLGAGEGDCYALSVSPMAYTADCGCDATV